MRSTSDATCQVRAGKPVGKGFAAVEAELEAAAEHNYYGDSALAALAKTGDLIEQYLHPSNNGQCVKIICLICNVHKAVRFLQLYASSSVKSRLA